MADLLSITAGVVGLLSAAGQVGSVLLKIKSSMHNAPNSIQHILSQVRELEICFAAVHQFIIGATPASPGRLSMIGVDQLVATLTESVLTFSELEDIITPFAIGSETSIRMRVKWMWKEDDASRIMRQLDRHKVSLSLMLNIVQCESDRGAEESQKSLFTLVQQLVESNTEISRRLQTLEHSLETESIITACFRNGTAVEAPEGGGATSEWPSDIPYRRASVTPGNLTTALQSRAFHSTFEVDLSHSRVYKRTQPYECDVSFTSSVVRTHSWSVLSGLSLSQISSISVIALPFYLYELSDKGQYRPLPSWNQCFALTDHQCHQILCYRDPTGTRAEKDWIHQDRRLVRLYMTRMSSPQIREFMESSSRCSAKTIADLYKDWNLPMDPYWREHTIRRLFSLVSKSEDFLNIPAHTHPRLLPKDDSPRPVIDPVIQTVSETQNPASATSPVIPKSAKWMLQYKIVVLGDTNVGKTALITRLIHQTFDEAYNPASMIAVEESWRKHVVIDGLPYVLDIQDTGNDGVSVQYTALSSALSNFDRWIRNGSNFILVYSVVNRMSFQRILEYHTRILRDNDTPSAREIDDYLLLHPAAKRLSIILVGNNIDLASEREVSTEEGHQLAQELGCGFVETSAKNDINVEKAFYDVVRDRRRKGLASVVPRTLDASPEASTEGRATDFNALSQHRRKQSKRAPRVWEKVTARTGLI